MSQFSSAARQTYDAARVAAEFATVVGRSFDQRQVRFIIPSITADLPLGVFVTLKRALESVQPEVRAAYGTAQRFWAQFDQLTTRAKAGDRLAYVAARRMLDFPEVEAIRLGYTRVGHGGSGIGRGDLNGLLFDVLYTSNELRRGIAIEPDLLGVAPLVGTDRASDAAASVVMPHLIAFTRWCAEFYGFDPRCLQPVPVPHQWDEASARFVTRVDTVPVDAMGKPIVLVPKVMGRSTCPFTAGQFLRSLPLTAGGTASEGDRGTEKVQLLAAAGANPGALATFAEEHLRDVSRFRERRQFRTPRSNWDE